MKRLIVCSDGTWQQLRSAFPTNVVKIAQAIKSTGDDGAPQIIFYDEGVGTGDWRDRLKGGAFGLGIDQNIQECYRFLCWNYEPGDEIYLYGFSRGAYTVRSLAGLVARFGLLSRKDIRLTPQAYDYYRIREDDPDYAQKKREAEAFRQNHGIVVAITVLGCWDTVGALGIPDQIPFIPIDQWVNRKNQFHDTILSPVVKNALHAVAIDEIRVAFDVTPMNRSAEDSQPLREVWFPGDHGCIGGGLLSTVGLSDRALLWMMAETQNCGLKLSFDTTQIKTGVQPDPTIDFNNTPQGVFRFMRRIRRDVSEDFADLDESVIKRWGDRPDYRPKNLSVHAAKLDSITA